MKDLKLMHMEFLLTSEHIHDILAFAKENRIKLYNMQVAAVDGEVTRAGNGATKPRNERQPGQQDWIVEHIKGETAGPELHEKWTAAGFKHGSFYGAIQRCIAHRMIKKVKPGVYKPVAKA